MSDYTDFARMRAELMRDYNPANAQERLLVSEVAAAWRRLEQAREHERLFFSLQRRVHAGESNADKEGAETLMWIEKPHKAYDQILRAIRDAGIAFDRAVRRIEMVIDHRLRREARLPKPAAVAAPAVEAEPGVIPFPSHPAEARRARIFQPAQACTRAG